MSDIFQIPAELIKLETKRSQKSIKLIFESQGDISSEAAKRALDWRYQLGWLTFSIRQIEVDDIADLPELKKENSKTQGQRQRAVIWHIWNRDNHGYKDFNLFYDWFMEKHIEWLKEKYLT